MKLNLFFIFLCTCLLNVQSVFAQTTMNFSFKIWKNSMTSANYLGAFTGTASTSDNIAPDFVTTAPMTGQLCPGDQLIIQQYCYKNGSQHNFNSSNWATVALTSNAGSSASSQPIATVCPTSPNPCATGAVSIPSWNWASTITITIPTNPSHSGYLAVSNNVIGNSTTCGLTAFIPMNLAPTTSIADQVICPGDAVSIPFNSNFTYSNWSPNNPTLAGNAPSTNTDYTVDITHTASGCTQSETFEIKVASPDVAIALPRHLCYDQSMLLPEDYISYLQGTDGTTSPVSLIANGVTIFNLDPSVNVFNLPFSIDAPTLGTGTIDFVYTYQKYGVTCTKTYQMQIQPQIVLNMQNSYAVCNSNFQPIFATFGGIVGQPGITYIWTQAGVPFAVGSGPFFTPSSYGTYYVRAYDAAGCEVTHSFTVYDPGVGIRHPANISFCSINEPTPSFVGWTEDPFGLMRYSFQWTYTDDNGATISINNTGPQYQVPYLGTGTYTAVVNANGCTETFTITVTDLLQVYNNHSNAAFSFTPLGGNMVSCQPSTSMINTNDSWVVVDQSGTVIPTTPYLNGIRFSYVTSIEYTVTFRRETPVRCRVYINEFSWLDNFGKNQSSSRRDYVADDASALNNTPTTVNSFPNPTTGLVNLQLKDAESVTTTIQVLNALGQVVLEKEVQNDYNIEVDLSRETSGIYLIHIINGTTQLTEKIVKE